MKQDKEDNKEDKNLTHTYTNFLRPFCKVHKKFTIYPSPIYLTIVVVVVAVVILFPEEYTKHMHNIITVISQNVLTIRSNEEQGEK